MAYIVNKEEDEEVVGEEQSTPGQPSGGLITPSSAPSQPLTPANQEAGSPGGFTDIRRYLSANQASGATGSAGSRLNDRITSNIDSAANEAQSAAQTGYATVQSQLDQATPESPLGLLAPAPTPPPAGSVQQAEVQPGVQRVGSLQQAQQDQIRNFLRAQGPQVAVDQAFQDARGRLENAQTFSELNQSEPGRFDLLRRFLGAPQYSRGQQRLDQAFLQLAPEAEVGRQAQNQRISQIGSQVQQQQEQARQAVAERGAALQGEQSNVRGRLQSEYDRLLSGLNTRRSSAENNLRANLERRASELQGLSRDSAQFGSLAEFMTGRADQGAQSGAPVFDPSRFRDNVDASQFVSLADPTVDLEEVASAEDLADLSALNSIAGFERPISSSRALNDELKFNREGYFSAVDEYLQGLSERAPNFQNDLGQIDYFSRFAQAPNVNRTVQMDLANRVKALIPRVRNAYTDLNQISPQLAAALGVNPNALEIEGDALSAENLARLQATYQAAQRADLLRQTALKPEQLSRFIREGRMDLPQLQGVRSLNFGGNLPTPSNPFGLIPPHAGLVSGPGGDGEVIDSFEYDPNDPRRSFINLGG